MESDLSNVLTPLVIIGGMATGIVMLTRTLTDYFLRKRMIDRGILGEDAHELLTQQTDSRHNTLKWGLIILWGGIGLIINSLIGETSDPMLQLGIFAVSLSVGFLLYFILTRILNEF
ncbi:MAG: hypothetical protein KDC57_02490 [Saprospiraceae bacterium]|nr:hypothetical protein [Saprospiraceae bacterium]